jgi:hypothetical protein
MQVGKPGLCFLSVESHHKTGMQVEAKGREEITQKWLRLVPALSHDFWRQSKVRLSDSLKLQIALLSSWPLTL